MIYEIKVPEFGVNDKGATILSLFVKEGERVTMGTPLCEIETSKTAFDLEAEHDGLVFWFVVAESTVLIQQTIGIIASTKEEVAAFFEQRDKTGTGESPTLTRPARLLAEKHGITPETLENNFVGIIRQEDVLNYLDRLGKTGQLQTIKSRALFVKRIAVLNATGGGICVAETAKEMGIYVTVIIDDGVSKTQDKVHGYQVVDVKTFLQHFADQTEAVFVHLQKEQKRRMIEFFKSKDIPSPTIIHPRAYVAPTAILGEGTLVKACAIIDSFSTIGDHSIIDNSCVVPHNCTVGQYTHVSPGVRMGGDVVIGDDVVIGIGAIISPGIHIQDRSIILPGAIVRKNVTTGQIIDGMSKCVGLVPEEREHSR